MSERSRSIASELQGITSLISDATIEITELVSEAQESIVTSQLLPPSPIQPLITGLSGITYSSIKLITRAVTAGIGKTLSLFELILGNARSSDQYERISSVLNGIIGDHLLETANPLAIPMGFRFDGEAIILDEEYISDIYPEPSGHLLIMVHGLCMNDFHWSRNEHNHGKKLAEECNLTPLYLHYNSGLHISDNGKTFNSIIDKLIESWPVPIESIVIVAHSMGGLVSRSAMHYAAHEGATWIEYLEKAIFLGTPHHGAPLERVGNYIDQFLGNLSFTKPYAKLAKVRSAGITDLRYGNLIDEDWQDQDRFEMNPDIRRHVPLPRDVSSYAIAATNGESKNDTSSRLTGDGLVYLNSAQGISGNADRNLLFPDSNMWIAYEVNHLGLLDNIEVYAQIKNWVTN